MIVYSATKKQFRADVMTNNIGGIVYDTYKRVTGRSTGRSEMKSWSNSLQYIERVLNDKDIPDDSGVAIEYRIPQSSKRVDIILTGLDEFNQETAILVELKQWETAKPTQKDAIVITRFQYGESETTHPSYQAWSYKKLLEDFNATVDEDNILLYPCAYLHNYLDDGIISNEFYGEYIRRAPLFLKPDAIKLQNFIKSHMKYGDKTKIMYRIDNGKIRPSKNLADELSSMLNHNEEFTMIDDQKVVYETALELARQSTENNKNVLIVEGGPGTGKSVVAINLLVACTDKQLMTQYISRNSAPREVYQARLTGSLTKSHIANLFSGSGSFYSLNPNTYDCLIVDEAHRLNEKSGLYGNNGENQIKEIINAAKFSIFFVDEDQKVTLKDIGDKDEILTWARVLKAHTTKLTLESQFRCNGSDGYLEWLDNCLQIRETANDTLNNIDFDFRVINSPTELHNLIFEKNKIKNKARLVAGYCWKWVSKYKPELKDIVIGDYKATWNLNSQGQSWIIHDSVTEVGCIHTAQGLEVDYIGVIIGPDLIVRNGTVITQPEKRASSDKSVWGMKKLLISDPVTTKARLDAIIKNTYRTLMSRGQKGCYIYCTDPETQEYFKSLANSIN